VSRTLINVPTRVYRNVLKYQWTDRAGALVPPFRAERSQQTGDLLPAVRGSLHSYRVTGPEQYFKAKPEFISQIPSLHAASGD
jgi:hypothetical protein